MNVRWQELSLIQKINTILLGVGHTTARVYNFLISNFLFMKLLMISENH